MKRASAKAALSGPVKATIWRGWQMCWNKPGAEYYQSHVVVLSPIPAVKPSGAHTNQALCATVKW